MRRGGNNSHRSFAAKRFDVMASTAAISAGDRLSCSPLRAMPAGGSSRKRSPAGRSHSLRWRSCRVERFSSRRICCETEVPRRDSAPEGPSRQVAASGITIARTRGRRWMGVWRLMVLITRLMAPDQGGGGVRLSREADSRGLGFLFPAAIQDGLILAETLTL